MDFLGISGRAPHSSFMLFLPFASLLGCHSPFVNATVENHTGNIISPLEVDYPSASFGKETIANGASFKYRFKVLGNGSTKVVWTDARHQEHTVPGPNLHEGQEGTLDIEITSTGATWTPLLKP